MSAKKRTAQGTGLVAGGTYVTSFGQQTSKLANDQITGQLMKFKQEGSYKDLNKLNKTRKPNWNRKITKGEATRFNRAVGLERKAVGLVKAGKAMNIVGAGMLAAEGIYKGTKRALDNPSFHKGKAGKSYLDLSVKKPGKYGVDY